MSSFFKGLAGGLVLGAGLCYVVVSKLSPSSLPGKSTAGVDASGFTCLLGGCGDEPLAVVQGTAVRWRDLPPSVRGTLHDRTMASWEGARDTLSAFAASVAIAKERGDTRPLDELPSLEEWIAQEPIDDAAVAAYFEKNKGSFAAGAKLDRLREQIRQIIRNTRTEEVKRQKTAELSAGGSAGGDGSKSRFELRVAPPRHVNVQEPAATFAALPPPPGSAAQASADPKGSGNDIHWLVEFTTYACEACGYSKLQIDDFLRSAKADVRFVRIAAGRGDALTTLFAKATFCAAKLGPETHAAFDVRAFAPYPAGYVPQVLGAGVQGAGAENAARAHVLKVAREAGVKDEAAFGECLGSGEAGGYLEAAVAYAKSAGAGSNAPTLILDGQRVPGGAAGLARYGALLLGTDSSTQAKR